MNISLNHPFFSFNKELANLYQPLYKFTLFRYFEYMRYYYDGTAIFIPPFAEFTIEILRQKLLPNLDELHYKKPHQVFLSETIALPETILYEDPLIKNIMIANNYGVHDRLCLLFKTPSYVEVIAFGFLDKHKNVFTNILNYLPIAEKFCIYFREAALNIITQLENDKVIFDPTDSSLPFDDLVFKEDIAYKEFLEEIKLKKYLIQGKQGSVSISKREFECLTLTLNNKSAKEIARILCLSPRTIEGYLDNIKIKLGCRSKYELIAIASRNHIIRSWPS